MNGFNPHQIVCLPARNDRLYAEIIQVIEARDSLWVRPLFLSGDDRETIDLRGDSDLILPSRLFRPALDTELIPFLSEFNKSEFDYSYHQQLRIFLKSIWFEPKTTNTKTI